jgi:hypothetical protein
MCAVYNCFLCIFNLKDIIIWNSETLSCHVFTLEILNTDLDPSQRDRTVHHEMMIISGSRECYFVPVFISPICMCHRAYIIYPFEAEEKMQRGNQGET